MKNWVDRITNLLFLVLIGTILYFIITDREKDPAKDIIEYWEQKGFKTDTVHVEVDYSKLPKPLFKYPVPPAIVHEYPKPSNPGYHLVIQDSLVKVIDSLQNEIASINERYFTIFPEAPKLLYGSFSRDTVELEFLNTDGFIQGVAYGVNLDRFKYQWLEGTFSAEPLPEIKQTNPRKLKFSLYSYIGYDLFLQSPLLKTEYNADLGRFRVQGSGYLPVQNTSSSGVSLNLGYRLK